MSESKAIEAPKLTLDRDNKAINLDTNMVVQGIAVFGPRPTASPAEESPITAMQRWSEFRQSPAPKVE
jgi:hypothetical protein